MNRQKMTVELVEHGPEHLTETLRWLTDNPRLREQIDCLSAPGSAAENEAYWRSKWAEKAREDYAIIADGKHVGNCGLSDIDTKRRKAQMWIYVAEGRGNGVGTAAVRELLSTAFNGLALEKVYLRVLSTNREAEAFYRRFGFIEEGRLRHDTLLGGKFVDAHLLSILASEFFRDNQR